MRNFLLFLASCVVCVLLGEVAVRLLLPAPGLTGFPPYSPQLLIPDERRSYAYRPGYVGRAGGGKFSIELAINNLGMRDDAVLPGEHIDVLAVGDSFTAGYMVSADEAWPARLEHHLQQYADPGATVRVLNGGVSGYSIRQIRYSAEDYLALKPDIMVVAAYLNAANRLFSPYVMFDGYTVRRHTINFLKSTDQGFLKALDTPGVSAETQFWLMENFKLGAWVWLQLGAFFEKPVDVPVYESVEAEFADYENELRLLKVAADKAGTELLVMLVAHQEMSGEFSDRLKNYNRVVTEYCVANGIAVYDPTPILDSNPEEGPEFRAGGVDFHWSPLGHELAAKGLAALLMQKRSSTSP